VRRVLPLGLLALGLAACGGGGDSAPPSVDLKGATAQTVAGGSAKFSLAITAVVAGSPVKTSETGGISFVERKAHLYKLVPGGGLPQELVFIGPFTYTNANIDAALRDSSVKPWTKLDNRRLSADQRRGRPDELAHVRAIAYLANGALRATRVGSAAHFRTRVDPALALARLPVAQRASIGTAFLNDYPARPFGAEFWLDAAGRVRRVRVAYKTERGTRIALDGSFSDFGAAVDLTLPAPDKIQDITP
jgi:hypothetical protein